MTTKTKLKPKKAATKGVLYIRELPEGVKNKFRSLCILREESMTQVVEEFMRRYIAVEGNPDALYRPARSA